MPKPKSHYINCETQISSRQVTILGHNYGSAIIYFTPKIVEKNVDPKSLSCEFVQVIDRGEWGKEEVSFSVEASASTNRKYREFFFENDGDTYELKFTPPAGLKLGIIDVYFDPDPTLNDFNSMGVSNPQTTDPNALTSAILAASPVLSQQIATQTGATVQAALANQAVAEESKNSKTNQFGVKAWSGDINNHKILDPNLARLGWHTMHPGKALNPQNTQDVFICVGSPVNRDVNKWDYLMNPGGEFNSDAERETMPVYMWVAPNKPDAIVTMTEYFP